ncbi:Uncharacterised protein [uncultured archaeon]|nr:Uncharacterised protein [uncultured archaeon]
MVLCIVALVVFAVLSIFSAKYRPLAAEAFDCVFRKMTLRKCETGLDQRIKGEIIGKLMMHNENAAGFVFKHFESISFAFTALFFASLLYSGYSVYNLFTLGTCDPSGGNCVFSPLVNGTVANQTGKPPCGLEGFVEFYGAECPHCLKMKPIVEQVESETGVNFTKLEVWHNESNVAVMQLHAADIERDCKFLGVPAFIGLKTNKSVCGEMTADKLKQFILENG